MKTEVFEHDYSKDLESLSLPGDDERADSIFKCITENGVFRAIDDRLQSLPRIINPVAKENFEQATSYLQFMAMVRGGKIKSIVNYENYDVTIDLRLPFIEFLDVEKEYLAFIASTAASLTFSTTKDGEVLLHVRYDYFEKIGNADEIIQDELKKIPEMFDTLTASIEEERQEALSDPRIYAMLEQGGASLGITAEEYYDLFNKAYNDNPQAFYDVILNRLKEKRDKDSDKV